MSLLVVSIAIRFSKATMTFVIICSNIQFLNNSHLIPEQPVLYFHKGEIYMKPESIDWNSIPDIISKDSFCKICHMNKKTATKYLGTVIPCSDIRSDIIYRYFPWFTAIPRPLSVLRRYQNRSWLLCTKLFTDSER